MNLTKTELELGVDFAALDPDQRLAALRLYADQMMSLMSASMEFGFLMTGIAGSLHAVLQDIPETGGATCKVAELTLEEVAVSGNFVERSKEIALSVGRSLRLILRPRPMARKRSEDMS